MKNNRKISILPFFALIVCCYAIQGIEAKSEIHISAGKGLGVSSQENGSQMIQAHAIKLHSPFETIDKFKLGYGLRLAHFSADQILNSHFETIALNLGFQAHYMLIPSLVFGLNLDVIGFSISGSTTERLNLLLGGRNDRGFLASEFFLQFNFIDHAFFRFGLAHLAVEQTPNAVGRRQTFTNLMLLNLGWIFDQNNNQNKH